MKISFDPKTLSINYRPRPISRSSFESSTIHMLPAFLSKFSVVEISASMIHQGANPSQIVEFSISSLSLVKLRKGSLEVEACCLGLIGPPVG